MNSHNGKSLVLDRLPVTCAHTGDCVKGAGAVFDKDCVYCNWGVDWPTYADLHINNTKLWPLC